MVNGWKVAAIIFIILFVVETGFLVWSISYGTEMINNKYECSNDICYNLDSDAFIYDDYSRTCECWKDDKLIHSKVIK